MKLSEEDKKRISAWFRKSQVKQNCLVCPEGKYALLDTPLTFPILDEETDINSMKLKEVVPFIMSQCRICGHTQLFAINILRE